MTLIPFLNSRNYISFSFAFVFAVGAFLQIQTADAQSKKGANSELAVVRGSIAHTGDFSKSNVEFSEIKTSLHQRVMPPAVPVPAQWPQMNKEDRLAWLKAFEASDQGKQFIAKRDKMVKEAGVFEVKYEEDGKFVIYEVPNGVYGLQGRIDKEIDGIVHAFEVFAQIHVEDGVEVVELKPIPIVTTPLFKSGQPAPALAVEDFKGENVFEFGSGPLEGKYVFLNFWYSGDPDTGYQKQIQEMYAKLKEQHSLELLSVSIDEDRKKANELIVERKLAGLQSFTDGWGHKVVESFGVRSTPSGWLIGPDGNIAMTQHEFYQAIKVKPSVAEVINDRIEGKDQPTLAERPDDAENKPVDVAARVLEMNKLNIQKLLNLMTLHQKRTSKAAESEKTLQEWLETSDNIAPNLEMMGIEIEKFEDYLVSERDGEKFDVRWGTFQVSGAAPEPFIFERVGVNGMRNVIWTGGKVTEVDQAEYEKLKE